MFQIKLPIFTKILISYKNFCEILKNLTETGLLNIY